MIVKPPKGNNAAKKKLINENKQSAA